MDLSQLELTLSNVNEDDSVPTELVKRYRDILQARMVPPEEVPVFYKRFPTLYRMIEGKKDISLLDVFLQRMDAINTGKETLGAAEKGLAEILNQRYVLPQLNKK